MSNTPLLRPRRLFVLALAIIVVGALASILYYRDLARHPAYAYSHAGGDTLTVAVAYSPMSLYRHGEQLGGLNYEVMRSMSSMFGFPVKFYPVVDIDEALGHIRDGRFDVLMADIPMFASLKEHYRFTVPVYTDKQVLVSRDTVVRNALDLAGKQVFVASGSPAVQRLENLSREIGDSIDIVVSPHSAEQLIILTAKGDVPRAVVNEDVARSLMPEYPDLRISADISFTQLQSWILNRDSTRLQSILDQRIDSFRHTTAYHDIVTRWADAPDTLSRN